MVYLQDAHNAARLAELDRHGVRVLPAIRSQVLRRTVARNVSGHLGEIAGRPAAVYVAGGRLWLAIDGQPWFLDELQAAIERVEAGYHVRISTPAQVYESHVDDSDLESDATPFADIEDFSFGLWVARIIENGERQKVLLDVLVDARLNDVPAHAETAAVNIRDGWKAPSATSEHRAGRKRSPE
jgi:hypothetical protein